MSAVPALMMCGLTFPVWRTFPVLLKAVQYPFRLNIVLWVMSAIGILLCAFRLRPKRLKKSS